MTVPGETQRQRAEANKSGLQKANLLGHDLRGADLEEADLSQANLGEFLRAVPGVLEVSIGHALVDEALYAGLDATVRAYRAILAAAG